MAYGCTTIFTGTPAKSTFSIQVLPKFTYRKPPAPTVRCMPLLGFPYVTLRSADQLMRQVYIEFPKRTPCIFDRAEIGLKTRNTTAPNSLRRSDARNANSDHPASSEKPKLDDADRHANKQIDP